FTFLARRSLHPVSCTLHVLSPLSLSVYIFFPPLPALLDLHSFPTRRSSDLPAPQHLRGGFFFQPRHALRSSRGLRRPERSACRGDRKSTRLNSSHGSISYAVFCLKKKTTTDTQHTPLIA